MHPRKTCICCCHRGHSHLTPVHTQTQQEPAMEDSLTPCIGHCAQRLAFSTPASLTWRSALLRRGAMPSTLSLVCTVTCRRIT